MNHQELYKLLTTVQKNVRCPQCGKAYDFSLIQIRGVLESVVFLELHCTGHMPLLATVTIGQSKIRQVPMQNTGQKISSDDVIEMYRFLKDFKGGFSEIFYKEKK